MTLELSDQGCFFVHYESHRSDFNSGNPLPIFDLDLGAPGEISVGQMYVEYQIPSQLRTDAKPIVFVHGGGHTGACWRSTPDGRPGWATSMLRRGYPVYVVDQVGRGRSGFDATPVNRAVRSGQTESIPNIFQFCTETLWSVFRLGPAPGRFYTDSQFPQDFLDHYRAQLVPDFNFGMTNPLESVDALAALLDRIGPATLLTHSQSGDFGFHLSRRRPDLVAAIVEIEGASTTEDGEIPGVHTRVPFLTVYGDHLGDQELYTATFAAAQELVARLREAGGDATLVHLPEVGVTGNGHMMMLELNSEEIIDRIDHWICEHVGTTDGRTGSF